MCLRFGSDAQVHHAIEIEMFERDTAVCVICLILHSISLFQHSEPEPKRASNPDLDRSSGKIEDACRFGCFGNQMFCSENVLAMTLDAVTAILKISTGS